jgi:hypothetical protein
MPLLSQPGQCRDGIAATDSSHPRPFPSLRAFELQCQGRRMSLGQLPVRRVASRLKCCLPVASSQRDCRSSSEKRNRTRNFRGGVAALRERFQCRDRRLGLPPFTQQLGQPNRSGTVVTCKFPKAGNVLVLRHLANQFAVDLRACAMPMLKYRDRSGCVLIATDEKHGCRHCFGGGFL